MKTARSRIHQKLGESRTPIKDAIHGYLACISYADAMMGRVLGCARKIVLTPTTRSSCSGATTAITMVRRGTGANTRLWERTSNVPFIWAGPGIARSQNTDATVSLIDIYPTLVELCDLSVPRQTLEGESLAPALAAPESARDRSVFLPHMNPGEYAVINRDWRYIRYGEDGDELYDLRTDPHEWHNLATDTVYSERMAEMQQVAPTTFAKPAQKLNARKDLVIDGESFRWERGKGNYSPLPKHLPYTP